MRYIITAVFGFIAVLLTVMLSFSVFFAVTDSWTWLLVSLGIFGSNIVAVLITASAFTAAKDY